MPTTTLSWDFLSDVMGWTAVPFGSGSWISGDGDPANGCFQGSETDILAQGGRRFSTVWADWGLPVDAIISEISCTLKWKVQATNGKTPPLDYSIAVFLDDGVMSYQIGATAFENTVTPPSSWFSFSGSTTGLAIANTGTRLGPNISIGCTNGVPLSTLFQARLDTVSISLTYSSVSLCVNFQGTVAREGCGSDESCNDYGLGVTNFTLCSPIAAGHYCLESNVVDLNGAVPGDNIRIRIRRAWNDPLNGSLDPCSLTKMAIEYDVS